MLTNARPWPAFHEIDWERLRGQDSRVGQALLDIPRAMYWIPVFRNTIYDTALITRPSN